MGNSEKKFINFYIPEEKKASVFLGETTGKPVVGLKNND